MAADATATVLAIVAMVAVLTSCGLGLAYAWLLPRAQREGNALLERFLKRHATSLLALPLAAAATTLLMTAVGLAMTRPLTAITVVHIFSWIFALAGIALTLQAISTYALAAKTPYLGSRQLRVTAYINAGASCMPLIAVAAVLSFVLTPGTWLETFAFEHALINPSFVPTLLFALLAAIVCGAGALALVVHLSRDTTPGEQHHLETRCSRLWWPLVLAVPLAPLYFMALPEKLKLFAFDAVSPTPLLFIAGIVSTALAALAVASGRMAHRGGTGFAGSLLASLLLVVAIACFTLFHIHLRTPYTINDYIYSNNIAVDDLPRLRREGLLNSMPGLIPIGTDLARMTPQLRGRWVYEAMGYARYPSCSLPRLSMTLSALPVERRRDILISILLDRRRVPPFAGTEGEFDDLIDYLIHQTRKGR